MASRLKWAANILLIIWMVIMTVLLFAPGSPYDGDLFFKGEDKVAHFGLFFGWSFLMTIRGMYSRYNNTYIYTGVVILAILGAISTEIIQGFIPYRSQDFFDFLADMVGVPVGILLAILAKRLIVSS